MKGEFLSCDWGTTALRIYLTDETSPRPIATVVSLEGVREVHAAWSAAGARAEQREGFFRDVLRSRLRQLAQETDRTLAGLPLVISGMASASVGLRELPYKQMPFAVDGSDLCSAVIPATADFPHPILLISGACGPDDVMRGEETQLVGALGPADTAQALMLFPGTHCKQVWVEGGRAVRHQTFMTGEFFELLSRRSILAHSVEAAGGTDPAGARAAFAAGVRTGATENLLHCAFRVRVGQLFGTRTKQAGYHYLSGLVLGAELGELDGLTDRDLILVGDAGQTGRYADGLRVLGWRGALREVSAESAVIAGQRCLATRADLL